MSFGERASGLVPFAVATGLLMSGAGGATAVADTGSTGSTGHTHFGAGASSQGSSPIGSNAGNRAGSVAGNPAGTLRRTIQEVTSMLGSGRTPGPQNLGPQNLGPQNLGPQTSSGATTQIVLHGMDNMQQKRNAGLFAAAPDVVGSVPEAVAPIPNPGTPVTNVVASVPGMLTPVANAITVSAPSAGASGPDAIAAVQNSMSSTDPDFISNTMNFFGLFANTAAADPDDHFNADVTSLPFFTDILTSGADPSGSLGFGAAGVGVAGQTVNTLETPFFNFTFAIPVTDPLAGLFTALIPLGF